MHEQIARPHQQDDHVTAGGEPLARVLGLSVYFDHGGHRTKVVDDVSFDLQAGRILALVGESGSGKSVTARTLLGLTGAGSTIDAARLEIEGVSVLGDSEGQWRKRRGRQVGLILQDALVSLDPLRSIGAEIGEVLDVHRLGAPTDRRGRIIAALAEAGVPEPETRMRQLSGELSGGLRQRALIANAIVGQPRILIADEPTTALDTSVQRQILSLLVERARQGVAILLITHDIAVVSEIADTIAVMQEGRIVEHGPTQRVLTAPRHAYTRSLLAALPAGRPKGVRLAAEATAAKELASTDSTANAPGAILVETISKKYPRTSGGSFNALDGVSFRVPRGKTLGIVGGSGAGKSTLAKILTGFLRPDSGEVEIMGRAWSSLTERERRPYRSKLQMIYQDAFSSFDPRLTVAGILADAFNARGLKDRQEIHRSSLDLLDRVGLQAKHLSASPLYLSGGQRQRVAIARALAPQPAILLCDEPVASLDASTQAQVLDLLAELQENLGLTCVFISHDLGVIQHVSDEILVLKEGQVVEQGSAASVYANPQHAYTRALFEDVPRIVHATPAITLSA